MDLNIKEHSKSTFGMIFVILAVIFLVLKFIFEDQIQTALQSFTTNYPITSLFLLISSTITACFLIYFNYQLSKKNKGLEALNTSYETSDQESILNLKEEKEQLQAELDKNRTRLTKVDNFKYQRFEAIKIGILNDKLKFGVTDYEPYSSTNGKNGIGPAVLKKIFEVIDDVQPADLKFKHKNTFDSLIDGLRDNEYSVIATPLFETRSRVYEEKTDLAFCVPLFYAEIGFYMNKDKFMETIDKYCDQISFSELDAIDFSNYKFAYMTNEISDTLARKKLRMSQDKRFDSKHLEADMIGKEGFSELLRFVNDGEADIVAMEVFKADSIIDEYGLTNVVNILKEKQLLYPVSFVVRKEETTLRHFLNLRIIELLYSSSDNKKLDNNNQLLSLIKEETKDHSVQGKDVFIHHYNNWSELGPLSE